MIRAALDATCHAMNEQLKLTPLSLMNESVFRFFFVQNLLRLCKDCRCQIEWNRIDLLVQNADKNILIEFKFFVLPKSYNLSGNRYRFKGGLGPKNFKEFCKCVEKLSNVHDAPYLRNETQAIWKKYLILTYVDHSDMKRTYRSHYDRIQLPDEMKESCQIVDEYKAPLMTDVTTNEQMLCKLIEIA